MCMSSKCNLSFRYGPEANKRGFTLILAEHSVHPGNPCPCTIQDGGRPWTGDGEPSGGAI